MVGMNYYVLLDQVEFDNTGYSTFTSGTQLNLHSSIGIFEPPAGSTPQVPHNSHSQNVKEIPNSSTGLQTLRSQQLLSWYSLYAYCTDSCNSDQNNLGYLAAAAALVLFVFLAAFIILFGIFIKKGKAICTQLCESQTSMIIHIMLSV